MESRTQRKEREEHVKEILERWESGCTMEETMEGGQVKEEKAGHVVDRGEREDSVQKTEEMGRGSN